MRVNHLKASVIVLLFVASLFIILPNQTVKAQTATISVTPQSNKVSVGQTFSVNIDVSNVQNLYALDISLTWSTSMLRLVNNQTLVGQSTGVLNSPVLFVQESADQSTGQCTIVASSENPAGPFSGSGIVETLTFKATNAGQSSLVLKSSTSNSPQLASYAAPGSGDTSQPISATVINGNVQASSGTITPPVSSSPTSSESPSSSPTPIASIPEFSVTVVVVIAVLTTMAAVVLSVRIRKNTAN